MSTRCFVLMIAGALAGTACRPRDHLPADAVMPKPGSLEEKVADLPPMGELVDWWTPYQHDDWLLIRLSSVNGTALAVMDASAGTVTTYCNRSTGGYDGPSRIGWVNDIGAWDLVDGRLYLRTEDEFIASCGTDGAVERVSIAHGAWEGTAVLVQGGFLSWRREGAQPSIFHWEEGREEILPYDGPPPRLVVKHRDARGLWWITEADGALTLWDLDGDTLAIAQLFTGSLDGATVIGGSPNSITNVEPNALAVNTDRGTLVASAAFGGTFSPTGATAPTTRSTPSRTGEALRTRAPAGASTSSRGAPSRSGARLRSASTSPWSSMVDLRRRSSPCTTTPRRPIRLTPS